MFLRVSTGVLAIAAFAGAASAADYSPAPGLMQRVDVASASAWSWTGLYGGVHIGSGEARTQLDNPVGQYLGTGSLFGDKLAAPTGFGGVQVGANWQLPNTNWVLGIEGEMSLLDGRASNTCLTASVYIASDNCGLRVHSSGSIAGRLGSTLGADNRTLLYGKAGVGYLSMTETQINNYTGFVPTQATQSRSSGALVVGGGLEYALTSAVSVKLEYEHYGLGSFAQPTTYTIAGTPVFLHNSPSFDTVKVGVNYHFGTTDPGPWETLPSAESLQGINIEVGARYWYSVGKFQKDLAADQSSSTSLVSRLTYQDKANSGELFGKAESQNVFLRGSIADGRLATSKLNDEDWLGVSEGPSIPYSNTLSTGKGTPASAILDIGYNFINSGGSKLGASIGYTYLYEQHQGIGCTQLTPLPYICGPGQVGPSTVAITETDNWNGLRLGLSGDAKLTDQLKLSVDAAYLPYVTFTGTDNHWLRDLVIKENGHGQGTQLQAVLSYDVTHDFSIGVGARYWAMWSDDGTDKFDGLPTDRTVAYKTERAGAFLQGSYKFNVQ